MVNKIIIRHATLEDIPEILNVENVAWGNELAATEGMFKSRINTFSYGTFVSIENNKITGVVVTQLVNYDIKNFSLSWYQATDNGYIEKTHDNNGKIVYGVNLSVIPNATKGTGTLLLEEIGKLAIRLNLKFGMLGGRIPDYHLHSDIPVGEYIKKTIFINNEKRLMDKELSFYKNAGLKIVKPIPNYMIDADSLNYGVLLIWKNPFYYVLKIFPFLKNKFIKIFKID